MKKTTIIIGDLTLDYPTGRLYFKDEQFFKLSRIRKQVLSELAENPDSLTKSNSLQKTVWGNYGHFIKRSLDVHISELRRILEMVDTQVNIETIHTEGYVLNLIKK